MCRQSLLVCDRFHCLVGASDWKDQSLLLLVTLLGYSEHVFGGGASCLAKCSILFIQQLLLGCGCTCLPSRYISIYQCQFFSLSLSLACCGGIRSLLLEARAHQSRHEEIFCDTSVRSLLKTRLMPSFVSSLLRSLDKLCTKSVAARFCASSASGDTPQNRRFYYQISVQMRSVPDVSTVRSVTKNSS